MLPGRSWELAKWKANRSSAIECSEHVMSEVRDSKHASPRSINSEEPITAPKPATRYAPP